MGGFTGQHGSSRTPGHTVFIVDDDEAIRRSLAYLVGSVGLAARVYRSGAEFLAAYPPTVPGCLVLDVRLPGMSGLEVLGRLTATGAILPTIMITGYADVSLAIRAMKAGAVDFVEKPFEDGELLDRIHRAVDHGARLRREENTRKEVAVRLARLTPREREVMDLVVAGATNREIASKLAITEKTVEVHRAKVMKKSGVRNLAELVTMAMISDVTADSGGLTW